MIEIKVKDINKKYLSENDRVYLGHPETGEIMKDQVYVFKTDWSRGGSFTLRLILEEELDNYSGYIPLDKYMRFEIIEKD